ncbi:hypothetical protein NQT62_15210 [Limnobacter humi]|uniref:Uncharacterized protein n=1 Tax=Limnobacter humi TaxID=1778671 RepID=A0ABT1WLI8_9BURK|nr:hypothetical protein [Limnobacter humi]MCQ8897789.1 hypothetical protein [Limnobacter humi]
MKQFIDSIVRTPGVLFMSMLATGFTVNAGVQFINGTNLEGPNLLAAGCLLIGQAALVIVQQLRKVGENRPALSLQ